MKNDNIHSVFSLFWLQILNLPASLQNKNTRIGPFPWKRSVLQNPDRERTNQSTGICLILGLPYNNICYSLAGRSVLGKTVPEVLDTARGRRPRAVLKTEGTVFPNTDRPKLVNNIFIFFYNTTKGVRKTRTF